MYICDCRNAVFLDFCNLWLYLSRVHFRLVSNSFGLVMTVVQSPPAPGLPNPLGPGHSPGETANYTAEMLESLRKIASRQGQGLLAHLLDLAFVEAKNQAARARPTTQNCPDGA